VDVTELVALRKRFQAEAGQKRRLTYLPFIMKAVVAGLKQYPLLNAALDEGQGQIQLKKYYNIGVATATKEGLIVPVVKRVDEKGILQIADEVYALTEATRTGEVSLEDLQDSTFTITSLGALGGVLATPIVNFPEVAILGVHKISSRPVVREGAVTIREIMNLTLSLDHRVVDGSVGAEFMHHIIPLIEEPGLLLLENG
jgi:pyruvate dehydrogenase E2 component (dihydrolipoamide acetyltransferase)